MLDTLHGVQEAAFMLESRRREGQERRFWEAELAPILRDPSQFNPNNWHLRDIFEAFVPDGAEAVREMRHRRHHEGLFQESGGAINTGDFSNIIGQITYSQVLMNLDQPAFIGRQLVTVVPATTQQQEIIPGIAMFGDDAEDVGEGEDYPIVGLGEEYVTAPKKVKDGFIAPVTEEAVLEDKTGLLMQRVNGASTALGITWEKEILDTCLGVTTSYSRNGGPAQATYGDTHTQGDFDNLAASNALVNQTDIDAALQLFNAITDPNTGEPILVGGRMQVVVPQALEMQLYNILNGASVEMGTRSATAPITISPNVLQASGRTFAAVTGAYVKNRTSSDTTWFIGDFPGAFQYREIFPLQFFSMNSNSDARFSRDIVAAVKVRRKGAPAVIEPRKVVKCTA